MVLKKSISKLIFILLILLNMPAIGQFNQKIGFDFGIEINQLKVNKTSNFSNSTSAYSASLFPILSGENSFNKLDFLSIKYGLGFSKQILWINPNIKINNIESFKNFPNDSVIINEVGVWDYKFIIPITAQFTIFKPIPIIEPFFVIPGLKVDLGFVNKITTKRINVDNRLISYIDSNEYYTKEFYDINWNKSVSNYYSKYFNKFDLLGFIGIELYQGYTDRLEISGSFRFNRYLISPIDNRISVDNDWGFTGLISIMYKIK